MLKFKKSFWARLFAS